MKKAVAIVLAACLILGLSAGVAYAGRGWYGTVDVTRNADGSVGLQWPAVRNADVYSVVVFDAVDYRVRIATVVPGASTAYTIDAATAQQWLSVGTNYGVTVGAGYARKSGDVHWSRWLVSYGTFTY